MTIFPFLTFKTIRCDTLDKMKAGVETMRQELKNDATFKEVYHFSFTFGLGENQKSLRKFNHTLKGEGSLRVV